ncbi:MAG: transglutaminase domain-containing protein, partial [Ktedonobacteraceae bacterium]
EPYASQGARGSNVQYVPQSGQSVPLSGRLPVQPVQKSQRRLVLAPAEGWLAMVLLAVAVYCVVYSIIAADYESSTFILPWSAFIGLFVGLGVAKMRKMPQGVLHLAACLLGHWLAVYLTSFVALHISWIVLLGNIRSTIVDGGISSIPSSADMVFLFYLTFLSFFLGYFGAWLIYRVHLPWLVAFVYCSIMLVNLNNVTKQDMSLLIVVLLAALLMLVARIHLSAQLAQWKQEGLHTDRIWLRGIISRSMQIALLLAIGTLLIGSIVPAVGQPQTGAAIWNNLTNVFSNITQGHISLQNPGSILQPYQTPANFFGNQLSITGSVHLPTGQVLYYTSSDAPQYLEGFTYDSFDGHTWTSHVSTTPQSFAAGTPLPTDAALQNSIQIKTNVTIVVPPQGAMYYIFGPAQPTTFDVATSIYGSGVTSAWTQQSPLAVGEQYQVTSTQPLAVPTDLEAIPYPRDDTGSWQQDPNYQLLKTFYLQTPTDLSTTVLQTARQWTRGTTNPYDALRQLEAHLSNQTVFTYSVDNPPVPGNVDAVDWLLQTRKGFCTYYATAMVMMARLLGIPTRMVSGFSHGHFAPQRNVWEVDGTDAHSWVQGYLPNYGWVNYDPTPGYAANAAPIQQATPPPAATPGPVKSTPPVTRKGTAPVQPPATPGNTGGTFGGAGQSLLVALTIGALLFSLLVLLLALATRWWRNLYPESTVIAGMYWRLCRVAGWAGFAPRASQTPYEYSFQLSQHVPRHTTVLQRLTELFVREKYAEPHNLPSHVLDEMGEHVRPDLRKAMVRLLFARFKKR